MKYKNILAILIILTGSLFLGSCTKETVYYYGPKITIYGDNPLYINVNDNWRDFVPSPQAYAYDDYYGIVDFFYRDNVNKEAVGKYTVQYVAIDIAGNETTKDRIVYVRNESNFLDGDYDVTNSINGTTIEFKSVITSSGGTNNRIFISQLTANTQGAIYADVINNSQIVIPQQKVGDYTYFGQGSISNVNQKVALVINYTEANGGISEQGFSSFQKIAIP